MSCVTCHYFRRHAPESISGDCRRRAPVWVDSRKGLDRFPLVSIDGWCGEYEAIDTIKVKIEGRPKN